MLAPKETNEDLALPDDACPVLNVGEEKEIGMQGLEKKNNSVNEVEVVDGRWQRPPLDIMENIVQRLDLLDRIRLSILCKYWRMIVMQIIRSALPFPWLVGRSKAASWLLFGTQPSSSYLEFSIPPEGRVIKLGLPKRNQGCFHSSSKGWLIMVNEEHSEVFLLNPISGAKHELPSLRRIPYFKKFGGKAGRFVDKIALSSSNLSECTVAAIFSSGEIGVCRPKKGWKISRMWDRKTYPSCLLFSSCGMLYVLVENTVKNSKSGHVVTRTLCLGDGDQLELKLVYDKEKSRKGSFNCWGEGDFLDVKVKDESYLIESTTSNEVLLIRQIKDQMKTDLNTWARTHDFLVYKIDPENGESFIEVQSLGNQILFVTRRGCSFSFPVSNSNESEANCIYFVELGGIDHDDMFCVENSGHSKTTMCDFSHPFYLDGRKFGRSKKFYDSIETEFTWGVSWYSPSLQ
ncbi:hypothetical protein C1H46_013132 [Malus baccata]|uniref:F-box domain-containing protein n=1 Tax=Malus baccata TaxID=106549 RepID=A0A540MR08_MALBA|nr:hypothetical protein C1H46_013132 [Malus baccata]